MKNVNNTRSDFVKELQVLVQQRLNVWTQTQNDVAPRLGEELKSLEEQIRGYSQTLANPNLAGCLRQQLEGDLTTILERKQDIESSLLEANSKSIQAECLVSESEINDRLARLHEVLANNDPTLGNLELSLHLDTIECFVDRTVKVRICKLGASPDVVDILAIEESPVENVPQAEVSAGSAKPRRRTRRKFFNADRGSLEDRALADFAADPNRFAGLPSEFFWTDVFTFPLNTSWSESHALEVWNFWKAEPGRSKNEVAMYFRKSLPTIRRALKCAEVQLGKNTAGTQMEGE